MDFLSDSTSLTATISERIGIVTLSRAENVHLPIYEDLVRERGDVVAEAQMAAADTEGQAAVLLGGGDAADRGGERTGPQSPPDFG